jgi:hypothetical protein
MEKKGFWYYLFWIPKELLKVLSDEASFFSKKRLESAFAFFMGEYQCTDYYLIHRFTMTPFEFCALVAVQFGVAGYTVNLIQKQKLNA